METNRRTFLKVAGVAGAVLATGIAAAVPVFAADKEDAVTEAGDVIDPRHRNETTFKQKEPRYYVWHEEDGWSLRTAALGDKETRFAGTVEVIDGTFDKVRAIGLEKKGKKKDAWEVDGERKKLTFQITTRGSFDGFDFTTKGNDARIRFTLRQAGKPQPGKIFIGKDGQHPKSNEFSFAAKPKKS